MSVDDLSEQEGRLLLRVARESLRAYLDGRPAPEAADLFEGATDPPPALEAPRGVFVTLTSAGRLRGCTGYVEARVPLWEAVRDLAVASASRDRRFPPVTRDELDRLHIEVSVLTPPRPIDPAEIEIGRHGLVVRMGAHAGLLLPQVAPEWGWDAAEFLARTCEKAGLPRDAWKAPGCEIRGFEAQIFDE
jgi:AmmeMemoRadiSam system protein A